MATLGLDDQLEELEVASKALCQGCRADSVVVFEEDLGNHWWHFIGTETGYVPSVPCLLGPCPAAHLQDEAENSWKDVDL